MQCANGTELQEDKKMASDLKSRIRLLQSKLYPSASSSPPSPSLERRSKEDELDSLSLSSGSSSSDSSEAPPTPPPRLSSLRQSQLDKETALAKTTSGCWRRQELSSGDNECVPLVAHASGQQQHQEGANVQQLLALQRANMIIGQHLYPSKPQQQALIQQLPGNCCWPQQRQQQQQHLQQHANLNFNALKPIRADNNNYKATCYAARGQQQQQQTVVFSCPAANRFGLLDAPSTTNNNLFADSTKPITKAVQDMVNQQQQATFVINNQPSSRQPIYGCATSRTPKLTQLRPASHAHPLGSVSSASLSSISSDSTGSSGRRNRGGLLEVARFSNKTSSISPTIKPNNWTPLATKKISSDSVQLLVGEVKKTEIEEEEEEQQSVGNGTRRREAQEPLLMMQEALKRLSRDNNEDQEEDDDESRRAEQQVLIESDLREAPMMISAAEKSSSLQSSENCIGSSEPDLESSSSRWEKSTKKKNEDVKKKADLLRLMRLRQQQVVANQELPTLQQLQRQIQQQKQQQQQQEPSQLQRTQQWTLAAAAMLQQQQQLHQQRQQRIDCAQRSSAGNAAQVEPTMEEMQIQMELEMEQSCVKNLSPPQQPIPHLPIITNHFNYNKLPIISSQKNEAKTLLTTAERLGCPTDSNIIIMPKPVPTPRFNSQQEKKSLHSELSILINPRLKDLSSSCMLSEVNNQSSSSCSPQHSILSDSTTLITEAAMNSSELIPKLIERLDRKLIVMKEEQLTLTREMELNESTGQRLFQCMKQHLTVNEFEKISLHANEIEKVTKLILSLKMRLKRVELELKERAMRNHSPQNPHFHKQTTTSQSGQRDSLLSSSNSTSRSQQQQTNSKANSNQTTTIQLPTVRGISDPTSTTGLPKRNHQHHASLQLASTGNQPDPLFATPSNCNTNNNDHQANALNLARHNHHHQLSLTNSSCDSSSTCSSHRNSSNLNRHAQPGSPHPPPPTHNSSEIQQTVVVEQQQDGAKTASSTSSDSIFNCADSAIGSTITGHGGSSCNIEQPAISQSSLSSSSSSSTHSSNRNLHRHNSSQSHLSSNISVSSHSSISSVPNSPQLVSPASAKQQQHHVQPIKSSSVVSSTSKSFNQNSLDNSNSSLSAFFKSDSNNNSTDPNASSTSTDTNDSMLQLLTDTDILIAKRNKLVSQLEEAHQLEECIVHRNNIIVQRILKKYYEDTDQEGEIAEFKQFTRLKSLLLKDTHDIADRIDNAELQLNELKQTNQCSA